MRAGSRLRPLELELRRRDRRPHLLALRRRELPLRRFAASDITEARSRALGFQLIQNQEVANVCA